MSDTFSPEAIMEQAGSAPRRPRRRSPRCATAQGSGQAIAVALERRKPLARMVAATAPRVPRQRKAQANGDIQLSLDDE
jgi:hypothetical protein